MRKYLDLVIVYGIVILTLAFLVHVAGSSKGYSEEAAKYILEK
jgi:hypothetical protein